MWAKLKKLGEPVNNKVAMEIVRQDGTISRDVVEVLERWHNDIAQLFSGLRQDPDIVFIIIIKFIVEYTIHCNSGTVL